MRKGELHEIWDEGQGRGVFLRHGLPDWANVRSPLPGLRPRRGETSQEATGGSLRGEVGVRPLF